LDNLRRTILQQLLTSTNTLIVVPREELLNIDAWERLALALKAPSRVDSATTTHLEQLTNTYWDLYRSAIAKGDLLSSVSGHLVTLTQLLRTSQPLAIQSRLCSAASNTCQIIGEIYFDMNNVTTAEAYYNLAIEAAHEVDNDPLEALSLGKIGVLSVYRGAYNESLPILQRAYALAENTTTGKSKSWLKWKEAETLSGLQKKDDCIAAVHQAEEVFDQDGSSSTGEDRRCTGPLIGYKGICYVHLHLPKEAQPLLLSALQQLPSGQARRRKAQILTNLALTYAWEEEIEEAYKVASQALLYAAQTKSSWAVSTLRNFQKEVRQWKDVYCVKKFNKLLNTVKGL
jgi:tetratricopeptide (TPR) repeat protein